MIQKHPDQYFDSLCTPTDLHIPQTSYSREGKFGDEEWFISASEHKVAEYLTLGVGISSTYAAGTDQAVSISLFFALSDCPFFSADI